MKNNSYLPTIKPCGKCKGEGLLSRTESRLLAFVKCSNPNCDNVGEAEVSYQLAIASWHRDKAVK